MGVSAPATLAQFARACVRAALGGSPAEPPVAPAILEPVATFVSLHWPDGRLQGCIGSLEPRRPLVEDVAANALAAAFDDPRAARLAIGDVDRLDIEVSILSPLEPVPCADEAEARAALRPFADGIVLRWHERRATFLPQVWEHLSDPGVFLAELRQKAGLAPDFWDADVRLFRYRVEIVRDPSRADA
jgi:AmmeMemoRadiSam system protein A